MYVYAQKFSVQPLFARCYLYVCLIPCCLSPSSPYKPIYYMYAFFKSVDSSRSVLYRHVWFQLLCRFIFLPFSLNLPETSNLHFKVSFLSLSNCLYPLFLSLIGSTPSLNLHLSFPTSSLSDLWFLICLVTPWLSPVAPHLYLRVFLFKKKKQHKTKAENQTRGILLISNFAA